MKYFVGQIAFLSFTLLLSSTGNIANAQNVSTIPPNPDFPTAEHPYAQAPNGCSGWSDPSQVRDTWGPVNFTGACNQHDRCYYTLGSNWNTCNERFFSDLRTACERDLRTRIPRTDRYLPPDPVRLSTCYGIATSYYTAAQAGVALDVFNEAQDKQRRYEEWVAVLSRSSSAPILATEFYLLTYGDLRNAFGSDLDAARNHWLTYGIGEGRRSSPAFDVQYYLGQYVDLQQAFGFNNYASAIDHWLTYGIGEGRRSSIVFDVRYYLGKYPDLQRAFGSTNYAAAVEHWLRYGVSEGRQGSSDFDPRFYLSSNPDVANVYGADNYMGAIAHYLEFGRGEGRRGTP